MNKSFDKFLITNFPEVYSENESIYHFLEGFKNWSVLEKEWIIDYSNDKETLDQFEKSGLRIEFWKYGYGSYEPTYQFDSTFLLQEDTSNLDSITLEELTVDDIDEEIIPITHKNYDPDLEEKLQKQREDSTQSLNLNGQFLYALLKYGQNDSLIKEYVEATYAVGDLSPSLKAGGLTYENLDLSTPLRKRLILMEFYYHFLKWNIENKRTSR